MKYNSETGFVFSALTEEELAELLTPEELLSQVIYLVGLFLF